MTAGNHVEGSGPPGPEWSPSVTVVVPTKNAARTLAACLASLRSQTYPCRTVVVDNGSTDATVAIAEAGADAVLHAGPERSAQRNHGARTYPADVVGFVDADMVVAPTVVAEAVAAIGDGAGSVIVPERTVGNGFWVEVRAFERSFYDGSDAIEAARFFHSDVFERTGGFDEQLTGPEDRDLSESARELAPVARIAAVIDHDEGTIGYLDACRKKAYYAEGLRHYVAKRGLWALYQASRRPWLHHPRQLLTRHGVGLVALKAGEAVAVAAALGRASATRVAARAAPRRAATRSVLAARTGQPARSRSCLSLVKRIRLRNGELVFDRDLHDRLAKEIDHRVPWIDGIVGGLSGKDVVDVGCWTGAVLRGIHASGARVCVGIDLPGPWIEVAKENVPCASVAAVPNLRSVPEHLLHGFDVVTFLETLEHLPTRSERVVLRSIRKLLRAEGTLVLSTPAAGLPALLDPAWYLTGHRHYSVRRLKRLLSACSFSITAIYYSGDVLSWMALMRHYAAKYVPGIREPGKSGSQRVDHPAGTLRARRGFLPQSIWMVATPSNARMPPRGYR